MEVRRFRLETGPVAGGKTVEEIGLRKRYGVTLLALRRNGEVLSSPGATTKLTAGDILLVAGQCGRLREVAGLFRDGQDGGEEMIGRECGVDGDGERV